MDGGQGETPYTETAMATTVKVDPAGDDAVAVGNGPERPLNLDIVNQNVHLTVGQKVLTAGPISTGTPAGLLVSTITSVISQPGDQSATVTVTPALPANPTTIAVIQQNH
jgi:cell shape-determining protein MreC